MIRHCCLPWATLQTAPEPANQTAATLPAQGRGTKAPRSNPDANGVYHLGKGVSPPKLLSGEEPNYTDKARKLRVQGTSIVALTVDENGQPRKVHTDRSILEQLTQSQGAPPSEKIAEACRSLDEDAVRAVEGYRFEPGRFSGAPVPVELEVNVSYKLYRQTAPARGSSQLGT